MLDYETYLKERRAAREPEVRHQEALTTFISLLDRARGNTGKPVRRKEAVIAYTELLDHERRMVRFGASKAALQQIRQVKRSLEEVVRSLGGFNHDHPAGGGSDKTRDRSFRGNRNHRR